MESCRSTYHAIAGEAFSFVRAQHSGTAPRLQNNLRLKPLLLFIIQAHTHHVPLYKLATPVVPL